MSGPLFVYVDWDKDGVFTEPLHDVSGRVRGGFSCSYGRENPSALSPVVAGRAGFVLDNRTRDYSPRNASSPLFGKVKPARPVLIQRQVGASTYTLFSGHTDDSPINPSVEDRTVELQCVDSLADFRGVTISTPLYQGITTGQAIGLVLDAAGWTGGRSLDRGSTFIPYYWEEGADAFDALQKLVFSEGPPALLTIDASGAVVFRDRQHRLTSTASTTSQSTWRGSGTAEPVMGKGFTYSDNWAGIVNFVSFPVDERQMTSGYVPVWSTDEAMGFSANEVKTILVQATDPFYDAQIPVAGKDFLVSTGSIVDVAISRNGGQSTSITLTAGASGASIVGLTLRAFSLPVVRTYQAKATDFASIADYGQRGLPSGQEPVWASRYDAQSIAYLLVAQRAQPLPQLSVRFVGQHTQTSRLSALLNIDLSDRVTVIEPETAVNGAFFVEQIAHTVTSMAEHEIVFGLEGVPTTPASVFILGTDSLGGSKTLGY